MAQTDANDEQSTPWREFAESVVPVAYSNTLGSHIVANQPDVEVMAILLTPVPLTPEKFKETCYGKEWVSMAFTVLQVGPPGFSSVPYSAGKKEKNMSSKKVYEIDDKGYTKFYPFEKGKSNKDKGERVSTAVPPDAQDAEPVDATITLEHGVMMSTFLRGDDLAVTGEECFPKMFALDASFEGRDSIPAHTVVYMQLSASNIEQAKKGQGLKVRKIKPVGPRDIVLGSCYASLPFGDSALSALMDRGREQMSLKGVLYRHTLRTFAVRAKSTAYAVKNDDTDDFVLCEADDLIEEIKFSQQQLMDVVGSGLTVDEALRFLNIALNMEAVRMMVVHDPNPIRTLEGGCLHETVVMELDMNQCLQFNTLSLFETWPQKTLNTNSEESGLRVQKKGLTTGSRPPTVLWSNPAYVHQTPGLERKKIVFGLLTCPQDDATDTERDAGHLPPLVETQHLLDSQMAGAFQTLTIYIASADIASEDFFSDAGTSKVLELEMRVENRKVSLCKKRKRPHLAMPTPSP